MEVAEPKKTRKKRQRADDRQLHLDVKIPAVVAEPMPEMVMEEEEAYEPPVSRWWHAYWNGMVGLSLIPFAWIFTDAFFQTLSRAMAGGHGLPFWMKHEFLMFALGGAIWFAWLIFCVWMWRRPRPVYLYVLGHELTHAAVATLFLGRVHKFKATSDGGFIETNRYNFLIALAPYLWPFYSVPVLALWSLSLLLPGFVHYREFFLMGLGFTWMFHLTFTLWMLPKGQTDFQGPGLLFSFALIYTVNIILLTGALVALAHSVTWRRYGTQLLDSGLAFYNELLHAITSVFAAIGHLFSALFS